MDASERRKTKSKGLSLTNEKDRTHDMAEAPEDEETETELHERDNIYFFYKQKKFNEEKANEKSDILNLYIIRKYCMEINL